ncbi:2841_t:CDS:1, partial [Racocetra persica]
PSSGSTQPTPFAAGCSTEGPGVSTPPHTGFLSVPERYPEYPNQVTPLVG